MSDALSPEELRAALVREPEPPAQEVTEPAKNLDSRLRQYEVDQASKEIPPRPIERREGWGIYENRRRSLVGIRDDVGAWADDLWCMLEPGRPGHLLVSVTRERAHAPHQFSIPLWVLRRLMGTEEPAAQPDLGAAGEVLRDILEPRS